jgi:hypothetical protein
VRSISFLMRPPALSTQLPPELVSVQLDNSEFGMGIQIE